MTWPNGTHKYSKEEDEWLRANADLYTWPELTIMFNEKFGTSIKSISDHGIKKLGIHKSFNIGDCKKGERRNTNTLPIGTERFNGQAVFIKIADDITGTVNRRMPSKSKDPNWKRKDYIVWEAAGNRAPKDWNEMLIHLNGDRQDCRLENLYLTTRKINFELVKNGWHFSDGILHVWLLCVVNYRQWLEILEEDKMDIKNEERVKELLGEYDNISNFLDWLVNSPGYHEEPSHKGVRMIVQMENEYGHRSEQLRINSESPLFYDILTAMKKYAKYLEVELNKL